MCHPIANLEHHHFKYAGFRRPGDVHVYFFGASTLSCADGIKPAVGASVLYLPPYSPDLTPIEQLFAKLKALLRKVAARTKEVLWSTIGDLIEHFLPEECANYLANCGYDPV